MPTDYYTDDKPPAGYRWATTDEQDAHEQDPTPSMSRVFWCRTYTSQGLPSDAERLAVPLDDQASSEHMHIRDDDRPSRCVCGAPVGRLGS